MLFSTETIEEAKKLVADSRGKLSRAQPDPVEPLCDTLNACIAQIETLQGQVGNESAKLEQCTKRVEDALANAVKQLGGKPDKDK